MTGPDVRQSDPGTWLLDRIDAREHSLTSQIEQTQAEIDTLTARLGELSEQVEHLRISRRLSSPSPKKIPPRPSRRRLSPITPPTSRFSPPSTRPTAPCAPVTWPWPWTCP